MKSETVKVTIDVPKGIDLFVRRIAALEGSKAKEWYEQFIQVEFDAIRDNNFVFEYFDAERMKQLYDYKAEERASE
jgi:uncharacterized protein YdaT